MSAGVDVRDRFEARLALDATGRLGAFNTVGVLSPADVHVARRLAEIGGEEDETVALAVALAVRGTRLGHVFVELSTIAATASVESEEPVDLGALPWPEPAAWVSAVAASPLVAVGEPAAGEAGAADRPLRLLGDHLYLDRYWGEERRVAADLVRLAAVPGESAEDDAVAHLFPADSDSGQRAAALAALQRRVVVLAGGPGTGKTTTVARIVAALAERAMATGEHPPLIALAAPTGKAAVRLQEAVHAEATAMAVEEPVREAMHGLSATTLHRLLGWRPGNRSRFLHDRENRLPHDVVIVDETSMISLSLMSRLVEAVRDDARLILVGDPGQLTSIEAGVVLGDIVGPAESVPVAERPPVGRGIVVLERVYRFGGHIATLAEAIRHGSVDDALAVLRDGGEDVLWIESDVADGAPVVVQARALAALQTVLTAARAGKASAALEALGAFRLLCAHRRGPYGVSTWATRVQGWLADAVGDLDDERPDDLGRPLLVTENDYELGLYNGDTGVVAWHPDGRAAAAFERGGKLTWFSPLQLGAVETLYAMTVHKSQGSQFATAAVLLPPADSPILTRELLYTAVTRARTELVLVGTEEAVASAVARPVTRASGLRERLWGSAG